MRKSEVNKITVTMYILILSFALISLGMNASPTLATKEQVGMFKNSKTCVVMDAGVSFINAPVKDAVQKFWKITEYEFIDQAEFAKRKKDTRYSFLVLMEGAFDKDPGGVSYSYLSLVLGDPSGNLTKMPEFCSIPLSYSGDNDADYEYAIPAIIKFMQIHVKNLEKDRLPISLNGLKYYNKTGFKDKVILFNEAKMSEENNTAEKISARYPYKFKLLSADEIKEQITDNPANTLFHFHIGPPQNGGAGKCFEMLFDTEGNLYYYNSRKVTNQNGDGFNPVDFNHII
jgi:hypothetical protein